MPKLILLNGPPGIGKSTLAQRYVEDHPLALNLDIDTVRCLLGRWIEHQERAGWMARALALQMARVHLLDGHDVVVPQLLGRPPFIEQLEQLAEAVPATFSRSCCWTRRSRRSNASRLTGCSRRCPGGSTRTRSSTAPEG